ncbi:MAG TPA: lysophospholipid acyltransferase family protein [Spirochaetia bacterium]|nr:lysophospholipid acyltransferase family protein [Spirochaetia bacterium]
MKPSSRLVTPLVKAILSMPCRVDSSELARVPRRGPLIVAINHINFLEVPLVYAHLYPRDSVGMVKRETWANPLIGLLADVWGSIALDRGSTDLRAMRLALDALAARRILLLAPEGTRSGHGRLQRGHGGIVQLALRSGAPILPVAHFGGEGFWANLRSLRKTRFVFRVGQAFRLRAPEGGLTKSARAEMTDQIMNRLSILLPPAYRGVYGEPESAPTDRLEFLGA